MFGVAEYHQIWSHMINKVCIYSTYKWNNSYYVENICWAIDCYVLSQLSQPYIEILNEIIASVQYFRHHFGLHHEKLIC
jgi:hypothetical protein